jgi:hypothetical protein
MIWQIACASEGLPASIGQIGALDEATKNRINAKGKFVNDGEIEA